MASKVFSLSWFHTWVLILPSQKICLELGEGKRKEERIIKSKTRWKVKKKYWTCFLNFPYSFSKNRTTEGNFFFNFLFLPIFSFSKFQTHPRILSHLNWEALAPHISCAIFLFLKETWVESNFLFIGKHFCTFLLLKGTTYKTKLSVHCRKFLLSLFSLHFEGTHPIFWKACYKKWNQRTTQ